MSCGRKVKFTSMMMVAEAITTDEVTLASGPRRGTNYSYQMFNAS